MCYCIRIFSIKTMEKYNIGYYPLQDCITIPCFDDKANLIGIRGRFLNPESQVKYLNLYEELPNPLLSKILK